MFLLRSLFPSKEVKVILEAVNELFIEVEGEILHKDSATLSEYQALKESKSIVKSYTKKKYVLAAYLLLEQEISPEQIALDFTCKCIADELKSGVYTSFTRDLTEKGKGVYKIYVAVIEKYEASGIQTPQQSAVILKEMKAEIRAAPYKSREGLSKYIYPKY